jgi:hypothetical protein
MDDGAKEEGGQGPDHGLYMQGFVKRVCNIKRLRKNHDRGEDRGEDRGGEEEKRGREKEDRALTSA